MVADDSQLDIEGAGCRMIQFKGRQVRPSDCLLALMATISPALSSVLTLSVSDCATFRAVLPITPLLKRPVTNR